MLFLNIYLVNGVVSEDDEHIIGMVQVPWWCCSLLTVLARNLSVLLRSLTYIELTLVCLVLLFVPDSRLV